MGWCQKISNKANATRCSCKPWMVCFTAIGSGAEVSAPLCIELFAGLCIAQWINALVWVGTSKSPL